MSTHANIVNVSSRKVERALEKFMRAHNCSSDEVDEIFHTCHVFYGNLQDFIRDQPRGAWVIHYPCFYEDIRSRRGFVADYFESTGEGLEPLIKSVRYRFGPETDSICDLNCSRSGRSRPIRGTERSLRKRR